MHPSTCELFTYFKEQNNNYAELHTRRKNNQEDFVEVFEKVRRNVSGVRSDGVAELGKKRREEKDPDSREEIKLPQ